MHVQKARQFPDLRRPAPSTLGQRSYSLPTTHPAFLPDTPSPVDNTATLKIYQDLLNEYVGPPYSWAEMYADRITCCPPGESQ